jgi:NAD(P)-dependent dehydrogenase (short-subunit alcohol dehydrogenase family)
MAAPPQLEGWALILGASSGFGGATAIELARRGMDVFGVHLDRAQTLPLARQVIADIEAQGRRAVFFNINAADDAKRAEVIARIQETAGSDAPVGLLLHSLAFGTLRPYMLPEDPKAALTRAQMEMTLDVMAHSLVYWTQDLIHAGLMGRGATIWAMTSAGDLRVIPTYGAVSAAKACLDAHIRQLAFELAPQGVRVNAIRAGVTDTPALRKIPVHQELMEQAARRNPSGRMTTPADVASAIAVLAQAGAAWMTGNIINVDGGEEIVA